jgi:hypothetical protein
MTGDHHRLLAKLAMSNNEYYYRFVERGRKLYEQGDKAELLFWLEWCIENHHPIPAWVERAFRSACAAARKHKIKSWDEVFGRPLKKGKRLATARRNREITGQIVDRVLERHEAGKPIDKELFDAVGKDLLAGDGKKHSVSGTVAAEIYYSSLKDWRDLQENLKKPGSFLDQKKPGSFRED